MAQNFFALDPRLVYLNCLFRINCIDFFLFCNRKHITYKNKINYLIVKSYKRNIYSLFIFLLTYNINTVSYCKHLEIRYLLVKTHKVNTYTLHIFLLLGNKIHDTYYKQTKKIYLIDKTHRRKSYTLHILLLFCNKNLGTYTCYKHIEITCLIVITHKLDSFFLLYHRCTRYLFFVMCFSVLKLSNYYFDSHIHCNKLSCTTHDEISIHTYTIHIQTTYTHTLLITQIHNSLFIHKILTHSHNHIVCTNRNLHLSYKLLCSKIYTDLYTYRVINAHPNENTWALCWEIGADLTSPLGIDGYLVATINKQTLSIRVRSLVFIFYSNG